MMHQLMEAITLFTIFYFFKKKNKALYLIVEDINTYMIPVKMTIPTEKKKFHSNTITIFQPYYKTNKISVIISHN